MARAPVSKTGGWGFESLHSCQPPVKLFKYQAFSSKWATLFSAGHFMSRKPSEARRLRLAAAV
jgi:hypothetical protein